MRTSADALPLGEKRSAASLIHSQHPNNQTLSHCSGIDCASARYDWMMLYAFCMVIIYPIGAPLLLFVMLFNYRAHLNLHTLKPRPKKNSLISS